jgi:hypothetical protein
VAKSRSPISLSDLIRAGILHTDDVLTHGRDEHATRLTSDGRIRLPDGKICSSPSEAARAVQSRSKLNGWAFWRVDRLGRKTLAEVRDQYHLTQHKEAE